MTKRTLILSLTLLGAAPVWGVSSIDEKKGKHTQRLTSSKPQNEDLQALLMGMIKKQSAMLKAKKAQQSAQLIQSAHQKAKKAQQNAQLIQSAQQQAQQLNDEITTLKDTNKGLNDEITTLKDTNKGLNDEITTLTEDNDKLNAANDELNVRITTLNAANDELNVRITTLNAANDELKAEKGPLPKNVLEAFKSVFEKASDIDSQSPKTLDEIDFDTLIDALGLSCTGNLRSILLNKKTDTGE